MRVMESGDGSTQFRSQAIIRGMSLNWPKPTHNHASEYQVSSWPWVTSSNVGTSAVKFSFGHVTRWVLIMNETPSGGSSKDVYVGFTQLGTNNSNHLHILSGQTVGPVEVKCTELWVKGSDATTPVTIMAGLTNVAAGDFPVISGSNGFNGVG
jgi:hypothetical protein